MTHHETRAPRLTKADVEIINTALALLEAEIEGEEPDPTRTGHDEYDGYTDDLAEWRARIDRIRAVRDKVHARRRS